MPTSGSSSVTELKFRLSTLRFGKLEAKSLGRVWRAQDAISRSCSRNNGTDGERDRVESWLDDKNTFRMSFTSPRSTSRRPPEPDSEEWLCSRKERTSRLWHFSSPAILDRQFWSRYSRLTEEKFLTSIVAKRFPEIRRSRKLMRDVEASNRGIWLALRSREVSAGSHSMFRTDVRQLWLRSRSRSRVLGERFH